MQAVCYQDMFYWDILTLEGGLIGYPKTLECSYHFMLHTIPEDSRSQNLFNFSVFVTGECQMVQYIYVL